MGGDYKPAGDVTKEVKYENVATAMSHYYDSECSAIGNSSNLLALLKAEFSWLWIGFYFLHQGNDNELLLGHFQGPPACTRIKKGRGVCGTAWDRQEAIVVPNVEEFPGHIACSSLSKSEIVIPMYYKGKFIGVLDIDSIDLATFDKIDCEWLTKLINDLTNQCNWSWFLME